MFTVNSCLLSQKSIKAINNFERKMSRLEEVRQFQKFGGQNLSSALAYRVYGDLQKTNRYSEVNKALNADLGIIYLIAKRGGRTHLFIPQLVSQNCNMYKLERIQSKLGEIYKQSVVHLAICDTASNVLYYTIKSGFIDDPTKWQKKVGFRL